MKFLLALLVILTLAAPARADDAAAVTDPAIVRHHFQEVSARPEFHETPETLADLRWGDWFSQWLRHLVARFHDFKYVGQLSSTARILVILITALAAAGLVALLVRLSRRRHAQAAEDPDETPNATTLLTPQQYHQRLHRAVEQKNWRGAWLATWLQFLARLENRHLADADRSQTNREYLAQLRTQSLPEGVVSLLVRTIDDYDQFIYGNRAIDEVRWHAFRERIEQLTLMLGLRDQRTEEPA